MTKGGAVTDGLQLTRPKLNRYLSKTKISYNPLPSEKKFLDLNTFD